MDGQSMRLRPSRLFILNMPEGMLTVVEMVAATR
jgi:hypothetical protein